MIRIVTSAALAALLALTAVPASGAVTAAHGKRFDGFNPHFNLGQAANGAVCEALRGFDGPLVDQGGRVWNVTCRGWSNTLGNLYVFPGAKAHGAEAVWRKDLTARTDCVSDKIVSKSEPGLGEKRTCKTLAASLGYVVYRWSGGGRVIAAEGRAPIDDVLKKGVRFLSGAVPEPQAIDAAVSKVSTANVSELGATDSAKDKSVESRRSDAYLKGQDWQFDQAETDFGDLANSDSAAGASARAEDLYNQALNASNSGRFDKAGIYFDQADALAKRDERTSGLNSSLLGLAFNYRAADARNQQDYDGAIAFADQAIAARARGATSNGARTVAGEVTIPEVGSADGAQRVSNADRERLRDAQALEIKATALEAGGRPAEARKVLLQAREILDTALPVSQSSQNVLYLGQAAPWLNARVWADMLRLDRGTDQQAETEKQFRAAVAFFGTKHPGSLPLAGFFLEQARAEAGTGHEDKAEDGNAEEGKAVADYQAAFTIFIDQRGSLADSADLARPYFDFLLRRIAGKPAAHPDDVKSFFGAAQALIAQSSAEAAKRQAANAQAGNNSTAALARGLQDTEHRQQVNEADIRKLNEQGINQGAEINRLEAEKKTLAEQNATLQGQLLEADPMYTASLQRLVDLDKLQKVLKPGEVYVKVFLLAGGGYGMVISPKEALPYRVDLTRDRAADMVASLRIPIDQPGHSRSGKLTHAAFDVALAHDLFERIFGPVRGPVLEAKHIIYEPDATLIAAPISALVTDDASVGLIKTKLAGSKPLDYVGVNWLGAHSYNSIALSASAFYQARIAPASKAPNPFYGYGDPVIPTDTEAFSSVKPSGPRATDADKELCARYRYSLTLLAPLPETRAEVTSVAKAVAGPTASGAQYAFGSEFTDAAVTHQGDIGTYKVIYFATHGLLDQDNPCLPTSLLTSHGGEGSDALLDLSKITTLRLDADMVVLSACNTGSNGHVRTKPTAAAVAAAAAAPRGRGAPIPRLGSGGGEALGGLVTSFVQAGARNVIVSNWEVDSGTTQRLMTSLFNHREVSQADALAQAERTLMNEPRYSHPYYWAPFTVVGDGDRPMPGVGGAVHDVAKSAPTGSGSPGT